MAGNTAYVVVHRWFPDGEGWAHDPFITPDHLLRIMQFFDRELKETGEAHFASPGLGGWLVGERRPDPTTQDRLAKHRSPTVFRVAFLVHQPNDEEVAAVRQYLSQVLPTSRGIQPLRIELPAPPAVPKESSVSVPAIVLTAAAAALLAVAFANVMVAPWPVAAALLAAGLLWCAGVVARWTGPTGLAMPPEELAHLLQLNWYEAPADGDDRRRERLLSPHWIGLQSDGAPVARQDFISSQRSPVGGGEGKLLSVVRDGHTLVVARQSAADSHKAAAQVIVQVYVLHHNGLPWLRGRWRLVFSHVQ